MSKFWFDEDVDLSETLVVFGENLGGHAASVEVVSWEEVERHRQEGVAKGSYWPVSQTAHVPHYKYQTFEPSYRGVTEYAKLPELPQSYDDEGNAYVPVLWPTNTEGPWYHPVWDTKNVAWQVASFLTGGAMEYMHMEPRSRSGTPTDAEWQSHNIAMGRFREKLMNQLKKPIMAKLLRLVDVVSPNDNFWQEAIWAQRGLSLETISNLLADDHLRSDYEKYSACRSALEHGTHGRWWRDLYPDGRFFNRLITIVGTRLLWYWPAVLDACRPHKPKEFRHISLEDTGIWRMKMLMFALGTIGPNSHFVAWVNNSSNEQCLRAWRKYARFTHISGNPGFKSLKNLHKDLMDAEAMADQHPEAGSLPGYEAGMIPVIEAMIKIQNNFLKINALEHSNETLAVPPWGEDAPRGWKRLRIGQELIQEGQEMRHCVGGYVPLAIAGESYIYHTTKEGDPCTVEITRDGHMRQARGVHDGKNKATKAAPSQWTRFIKNLYPCDWCGAPADIDYLIEHGRCSRCEQLWGDRQPDLTLPQLPQRVPWRDENAGSFGINPAGEAEDYIPF